MAERLCEKVLNIDSSLSNDPDLVLKGGRRRREGIGDDGGGRGWDNAEMVQRAIPGRIHPQKRMRLSEGERVYRDGDYRTDIQYSGARGARLLE